MDLIDDAPNAKVFVDEVISNINKYRLWPEEQFINLFSCVMATTGQDTQGECFSLEALKSFVRSTHDEPIWIGAHHDPLIQPLGRSIASQIFYSKSREMHFILAVIGQYDVAAIPSFKGAGIEMGVSTISPPIEKLELRESDIITISRSPFEIEESELMKLLDNAPEAVSRIPRRAFRKSAEIPTAILELIVPLQYLAGAYIALNNPFSTKALEVLGDSAGKKIIEFMAWLRTNVVDAVKQLRGKKKLLQIRFNLDGVWIQFVVAYTDSVSFVKAVDTLPDGFAAAQRLVERMKSLDPHRITFEYDSNLNRWLPLHATTRKRGVICDRPIIIMLSELKGMSIGGTQSG